MSAAPETRTRERGASSLPAGPLTALAVPSGPRRVRLHVHPEPIRVLLLDDDGRPVSGARVSAEARQADLADSALFPQVPGLLDPVVDVSLGDGEVVLGGLADVVYRVSVAREGCVGRLGVEARPGHDLIVTLRGGASFRGQVLDAESGAPIREALVRVSGIDWNHRESTRGAAWTNDHGVFEILGVGDHAIEILVSAPWYPEFRLELPAGAPAPVLMLHRAPRGVAGRFIDAKTGEGIAGVRLRGPGAETESSTDGSFLLCGLMVPEEAGSVPSGAVRIEAEHPAYDLWSLDVELPVVIPPGEGQAVELGTIAWEPRPCIDGSVRDLDGSPLEDALVVLARPGSNLTQAQVLRGCRLTWTAPGGRFRFERYPMEFGRMDLAVFTADGRIAFLPLDQAPAGPVELVIERGMDLTLALAVPVEAGRPVVLEEQGIARAGVGPKTTLRRRVLSADAAGQVVFPDVRPGPARVTLPGSGLMEFTVAPTGPAGVLVEPRRSELRAV